MKNKNSWQPSKFVFRNGELHGSRDTHEVGVASRLMADAVAKAYQRNLRLFAKGRLLDLGCGQVPLFEAYRDFITDNVCVDWANSLHKNDYLDYECDLTSSLPFSAGEFDTILLSDVLEHVPQPEELWAEMTRVLAPNGNIIVNVPFFYWLHERPHDYYRYTEHALRRFADRCGLTVLHLEPIGGAPEIVADIVSKNVIRLPRVGRALARFVQWTGSILLRTRLGQRLSDSSASDFPFGYFLVAQKR